MAVILENSVILHVPKTAGKYVRTVLDVNGIPYRQTSHNTVCDSMGKVLNGAHSSHCIPREDREYQERQDRLVFVRHPLTWYISYWAFRMRFKDSKRQWMYWRRDSEFDQTCGDDDFGRFIDKVLDKWPGFLSQFFEHYVAEASDVGRMEEIGWGLFTFLNRHEGVGMLRVPGQKVNTTKHDDVKYTERQAAAIMEAESEVIDKYRYNYVPEGVV